MAVSCGDPLTARAAKVVLVTFFRGEGDMRREVLQVFAEDGELLAEHDAIHEDPVYASYFLRRRARHDWLVQQEREPDPAQAMQEVAHG